MSGEWFSTLEREIADVRTKLGLRHRHVREIVPGDTYVNVNSVFDNDAMRWTTQVTTALIVSVVPHPRTREGSTEIHILVDRTGVFEKLTYHAMSKIWTF